jgi:predicted nuclease of predicted toxin-antitoxin system
LSVLRGQPPKIVWLALGNTTTALMAALVRSHRTTIACFLRDPDTAILVIQPTASVAK